MQMIIPIIYCVLRHRVKEFEVLIYALKPSYILVVNLLRKVVISIPNNYVVNILAEFKYFFAVLVFFIYG